MLIVKFQPFEGVLQGLITADIIDDEAAARVLEVAGNEAFESFLPRCVPKLDAVMLLPVGDVLHQEVNAYRSLIEQRCTL